MKNKPVALNSSEQLSGADSIREENRTKQPAVAIGFMSGLCPRCQSCENDYIHDFTMEKECHKCGFTWILKTDC